MALHVPTPLLPFPLQMQSQMQQLDALQAKDAAHWEGVRASLRRDMDAATKECVTKLKAAQAPAAKPKSLGIVSALQHMLQSSLGNL